MPRSLWCSASRKPGLNSPASMVAPLRSSTVLPARPPPSTSSAASVSTPYASRNTIASASSSMLPATMSWLAALTVCPEPAGPTWTIVLPTASSTGLAASKSAASPPTMIDRLASIAPASPPLTGASSTRSPRCAARLGHPDGDVRPDRAHVDVERALSGVGEDPVVAAGHGLDVRRVGHHRDDHVGVAHGAGHVVGAAPAALDERPDLLAGCGCSRRRRSRP